MPLHEGATAQKTEHGAHYLETAGSNLGEDQLCTGGYESKLQLLNLDLKGGLPHVALLIQVWH